MARRALVVAVCGTLLLACGPAQLTHAEATRIIRIIREQFFRNQAWAETASFSEGQRCLKRHNDFRTHVVEALERHGYLAVRRTSRSDPVRAAPVPCDPSSESVDIELTAKGTVRAGREDWSVSAGTHLVTLVRRYFLEVRTVTHRSRDQAQAVFLIRSGRTPIGEETDVVGTAHEPMTAEFKRFADGWKITTVMSKREGYALRASARQAV